DHPLEVGQSIDFANPQGRRGDSAAGAPAGTPGLRSLQQRMIQNRGFDLRNPPGDPPGTEGWAGHRQEIENVQNYLGDLLDEYEACCRRLLPTATKVGARERREFNERVERGRRWQNMNSPQPEHWQVPINQVPLGW